MISSRAKTNSSNILKLQSWSSLQSFPIDSKVYTFKFCAYKANENGDFESPNESIYTAVVAEKRAQDVGVFYL